ncbi:Nucleophosmin [Myotis davidii]|uniref:Nucleophosmin n=1 Tax=Myotis davidii TaxID=225400 RepID=L5M7Z8_MYODS|nr:Nucleophosmin [Myotis davidii]
MLVLEEVPLLLVRFCPARPCRSTEALYLRPPSLSPKCALPPPPPPMEDSMDVGMSPLRPQNDLFGCELKADKDDHLNVNSDENEHQLSLQTASPPLFILEHLRKVRFYGHNTQADPEELKETASEPSGSARTIDLLRSSLR